MEAPIVDGGGSRLRQACEAEGIIDANPAHRIRTPQPKRKEPKGIAWEDFVALLRTTEGGSVMDLRDKAILLFLADTGCRAGGLCGLTVEDVDFDNGLAAVTEKREMTRLVPFTNHTARVLQDWLDVRPQDKGPWVVLALASSFAPILWGTLWGELRDGLLPNLGTEMIAEMGSGVRDVAVPAADELRRRGWLTDGALRGANLSRADLREANLRGADLIGANLSEANLSGALWPRRLSSS